MTLSTRCDDVIHDLRCPWDYVPINDKEGNYRKSIRMNIITFFVLEFVCEGLGQKTYYHNSNMPALFYSIAHLLILIPGYSIR